MKSNLINSKAGKAKKLINQHVENNSNKESLFNDNFIDQIIEIMFPFREPADGYNLLAGGYKHQLNDILNGDGTPGKRVAKDIIRENHKNKKCHKEKLFGHGCKLSKHIINQFVEYPIPNINMNSMLISLCPNNEEKQRIQRRLCNTIEKQSLNINKDQKVKFANSILEHLQEKYPSTFFGHDSYGGFDENKLITLLTKSGTESFKNLDSDAVRQMFKQSQVEDALNLHLQGNYNMIRAFINNPNNAKKFIKKLKDKKESDPEAYKDRIQGFNTICEVLEVSNDWVKKLEDRVAKAEKGKKILPISYNPTKPPQEEKKAPKHTKPQAKQTLLSSLSPSPHTKENARASFSQTFKKPAMLIALGVAMPLTILLFTINPLIGGIMLAAMVFGVGAGFAYEAHKQHHSTTDAGYNPISPPQSDKKTPYTALSTSLTQHKNSFVSRLRQEKENIQQRVFGK